MILKSVSMTIIDIINLFISIYNIMTYSNQGHRYYLINVCKQILMKHCTLCSLPHNAIIPSTQTVSLIFLCILKLWNKGAITTKECIIASYFCSKGTMPLWSGGMTVCDRLIAVSQPAQILAGFMVKSTPPTTYFMFAVHGLYVGAFSLQVLLVSL